MFQQHFGQTSATNSKARAKEVVLLVNDLLPNPSIIFFEQKMRDHEMSNREIAEIINAEQALAAKIMRMANSAFYSQADAAAVKTLPHAISLLGEKMVRHLILATIYLLRDNRRRSPTDALAAARLSANAVRAGAISRHLAQLTGIRDRDAIDTAFLCGLLHDIGAMYLVDVAKDSYSSFYLNSQARSYDENLRIKELRSVGTTHEEVGEAWALQAQVPEEIREAVASHHSAPAGSMAQIVNVADALSREMTMVPSERIRAEAELGLSKLGIERTQWERRRDQMVKPDISELLRFFDLRSS